MKKILFSMLPLIILAACQDAPANTDEADVPFDEIAANLETPWSINKTGEAFYISERPGTIAHIDEEGTLTRQAVDFSDPLSSAAEAGFLGFALSPDFEDSKEAYGYYVYEQDGDSYNKIVQLKLEGDAWSETAILLEDIPTGNVHHGGRLEFDEDGTLFATIGDASDPDLAQDPDAVNGKILKLNESGVFETYTLGHRNPQGIAWHDGDMFAAEHGQSANDEINQIEEGKNYGWPLIEGMETESGLEPPLFTTGDDETWAPSGIAAHNGLLYIAALRGTAIKILDLETNELVDSIEGFGRVRDVFSDGEALYFITNNTDGRGTPTEGDDKLYQLSP